MRHKHSIKKLSRTGSHRRATLKNMSEALLSNERIVTTATKAKVLRSHTEKLITLGKRGDLHARRLAARAIHNHDTLQKLFGEIAERYASRNGGYTRVLKLEARRGDRAPMALIELVDGKLKEKAPKGEAEAAE